MAILGTKDSGHCKEVAVVERFTHERLYGPSPANEWQLW